MEIGGMLVGEVRPWMIISGGPRHSMDHGTCVRRRDQPGTWPSASLRGQQGWLVVGVGSAQSGHGASCPPATPRLAYTRGLCVADPLTTVRPCRRPHCECLSGRCDDAPRPRVMCGVPRPRGTGRVLVLSQRANHMKL